jgi:hypothetical protein
MTFEELVANGSYVQRPPTAPIFASHPLQVRGRGRGRGRGKGRGRGRSSS